MLKKLFRPKWQHNNPAVRNEAARKLDPSITEHYQILTELANNDSDLDVRQTAITKITDLSLLKKFADNNSDSAQQAASQRCADLISGLAVGLDDKQRLLALDSCSQQLLFEIANHSPIKLIQEHAITLLTQQDLLLQLTTENTNSQIRQLAVAGIIEPDTLKAAINALKTRDKRALQMARSKLNSLKEQDRCRAETLQQHEALCQQMESLAKSSYSPQYSGKYHHLQQQCRSVDTAINENIKARFDKAASTCQSVVEQFEEEEREKLADEEAQHQQVKRQEGICDELEQLISNISESSAITQETLDTYTEKLNPLKSEWQGIIAENRAHPKEQMRYDKATLILDDFLSATKNLINQSSVIDSLQEEISQHSHYTFSQLNLWLKKAEKSLARIRWPESIAAPQQLAQLRAISTKLKDELKKLEEQQQQIKTTLQQQLADFDQKLENGDIDDARHLQTKIRNNMHKLASKESKTFEQRYVQLSKQLSEFDDWRQYATDPKRITLCEEMEKLIDVAIPPQHKAQSIKELQQEWKKLGNARNTQQLWQRFKKAADRAYIPCKQHFQQQSDLRSHNFNQRQQICEQLKQFETQTDWENTDWKAAEKIYATAKLEWKAFNPVDRTKAEGLQKEFNALLDTLNEKLRNERQRNASEKEQLVEQAKALIQHEDVQEAIELVKKLQQQWTKIGITYRKDNQKIWKTFREFCDQIFERRNQEREVEQHEREENLKQALELCQRIRELANQPDDELSESQSRFKSLKDEHIQLGPIPKQHYQDAQQQFQESCDHFQTQYKGIAGRSKLKALSLLESCASTCKQLEDLPANDEQRNRIQNEWQKPEGLPDDWWQAINQRFQSAVTNTEKNTDDSALRLLCIRAEILAELDTPAEDQQRRMNFQMNRLSEGLGQQQQKNHQEEKEALQLEWRCSRSVDSAVYSELEQRFAKALTQTKN